ncbi:MAG: molybdenum cofactor biosynthesis protein MoaE [Planctomycetes bacterium]|nr:molybdenum cofactor biosynthesis protein MoaE [Planctomycetota bacterium]
MKVYSRLVEAVATNWWCIQQLGSDDSVGCKLAFSGQVRASNNNRNDVVALHYQAYPEMFQREVEKIASELEGKFELTAIAIEHSIGEVKLGEDAVHVVVCAAHRRDTFAALEFFMAQLKKRVPIFKKEIYSDSAEWLGEQQ